jgi:hypothetical protein
MLAQVLRARADHAPVGSQLARRERGIGQGRDPDGEVEAVLDQVTLRSERLRASCTAG